MKSCLRLSIGLALILAVLTSFTSVSYGAPPKRPTERPSFFPETPSQSPKAVQKSANRNAPQAQQAATDNKAATMANEIGLKILQNLHKQGKADENIVVSPTSIGLALAMTLNGADGNTLKEMATALDVDPAKLTELNKSVAALLDELVQGDPDAELSVSNAVFVKKDAPFEQAFLLALKKQYQAKAKGLDFTKDPKGAVNEINNWVKKETNDKIQSLFDTLPPETQAVIANAVYFKGTWTKPFDEKLTTKRDFNLSSGPKKMDTMQRSSSFVYMETPEFQAVRLPYGTGRFAMFVLLPKDGKDVEVILPELSNQKWTQHRQNFTSSRGQLYLPKFKLELSYELNDTLKKTGIKEAFSDTLADFGKMLKLTPQDRVKIDKVVHKIYIDVNEKNTEAAAVTGVASGTASASAPSKPFVMDCNKSFVILIQDRNTGAVLFSGVIANPAGK